MPIKRIIARGCGFLEPIFKNNYFTICFSSSNYYVPYLTVTLLSLKKNANVNYNYDIIIFNKDITEKNKTVIKNTIEQKNISVRFFSVNDIFKNTNINVPTVYNGTVTIETYFRLLVPLILRKYKKALFLDCDMIVLSDLKELYETDISNYALAACHEILLLPSFVEAIKITYSDIKNPFKIGERNYYRIGEENCRRQLNKLGIDDINEYFQAGMILFNCDFFNEHHYCEKLFKNIQRRNYNIVDQDALNELCRKHVCLLDGKWNYTPKCQGTFYRNMTKENKNKVNSIKKPKIIHFVGAYWKPWNGYRENWHKLWWRYAENSPYYDTIIKRTQKYQKPLIKNYNKNKYKFLKYKILCNLTFGKIHQICFNKKYTYKNAAKQLKKRIGRI